MDVVGFQPETPIEGAQLLKGRGPESEGWQTDTIRDGMGGSQKCEACKNLEIKTKGFHIFASSERINPAETAVFMRETS